jgi:hypothetical protein
MSRWFGTAPAFIRRRKWSLPPCNVLQGGSRASAGRDRRTTVLVTFYVADEANSAKSAWLRLPTGLANYLLFALAYEPWEPIFFGQLRPEDVLARIASVRRQFALGRGCEFTSALIEEPLLLGELTQLERLAEHARQRDTSVLLL